MASLVAVVLSLLAIQAIGENNRGALAPYLGSWVIVDTDRDDEDLPVSIAVALMPEAPAPGRRARRPETIQVERVFRDRRTNETVVFGTAGGVSSGAPSGSPALQSLQMARITNGCIEYFDGSYGSSAIEHSERWCLTAPDDMVVETSVRRAGQASGSKPRRYSRRR